MKGYTPLVDKDFFAQIHEFFFRLESLSIQGIACRDLSAFAEDHGLSRG